MKEAILFFLMLSSCIPAKNTQRTESKVLSSEAQVSKRSEEDVSLTQNQSRGRFVTLYDIRGELDLKPMQPPLDSLPCAHFKQGPSFTIAAFTGGPPIPIPGPVQNNYSGQWLNDQDYMFRLTVWKRLYTDPGIPSWSFEKPKDRTIEYVQKLFDVVVANATSKECQVSGKVIN